MVGSQPPLGIAVRGIPVRAQCAAHCAAQCAGQCAAQCSAQCAAQSVASISLSVRRAWARAAGLRGAGLGKFSGDYFFAKLCKMILKTFPAPGNP